MLPCIVECYNSDETVHPDIYEAHAQLLFSNISGVIDFLVRDTKRKNALEEEVADPRNEEFEKRFRELQEQNIHESTQKHKGGSSSGNESSDVSDCQSDYSELSGYSSSNDNLR